NQRVDYGARRGMIMRFMAIFIGSFIGLYGLRESVALERPYNLIVGIGSVVLGLAIWRLFHWAAGRGVRVWVLAKGKLNRTRLARAILISLLPSRRRRHRA
ncbi:MAG: hypothetical protein KC731_41905, partial [Myxococcales bacterium]|nr:hypothetical protein [Myxococcales bacterium]